MYEIDFHADDYAASVESSGRILALMQAGRIDSASVIANMGCFESCMAMLREEWESLPRKPLLSVHVNLIDGYWLSSPEGKRIISHSWAKLFLRGFLPGRKKLLDALSAEIEAQIRAFQAQTADLRDDQGKHIQLRIDSHVHTHMIPLVFQALMDALDRMHIRDQVGFIRCSTEPLGVILFTPGVMGTISPVNILKNITLRALSRRVRRKLEKAKIPNGCIFGIAMTGEMDLRRVSLLLPKMKSYAQGKNAYLEIMAHPGRAASAEITEEYGPDDRKAFLSPGRDREYEMLMNIQGKNSPEKGDTMTA